MLLIFVLILGAFFVITNGEKDTHKVKFYVDNEVVAVQTVEDGNKLKSVINPTKEGYTFVGWSTSENGEIIDLTKAKITKNKTLYAVFEEDETEPEEPTPEEQEPEEKQGYNYFK